MRKLPELSSALKAVLEDDLEKRIPKTTFRQSVLYKIADLLCTLQIKLLEANKTKSDTKSYKDNLDASDTLNLAFVMMTDLQGENSLLRSELLTLRHEAEIIIAELSNRIETLEFIDEL
jgi:hypothetical protein